VEAITHLRTGLALLQTLPATPECSQHELLLHIALGVSLIATKGYAALEVEQTYTRAQHLCEHLDNPHQLFPVLRGLWNYHLVRAEYQTAHALSEQLLTLAQQVHKSTMLVAAHRALGTTSFVLGAVATAHTHFRQGIQLYDSRQHRVSTFLYGEDAGVICRSQDAWALWCLGYPDQGLVRSDEAVTLAQQMAHPYSLGFALNCAAMFHQYRREGRATQEHAEANISLATEQGFPHWMAQGSLLRGWAPGAAGTGRRRAALPGLDSLACYWRRVGATVLASAPR
jgi:predicted ATPase